MMIAKGSNKRLQVEVLPSKTTNKKVVWSSSNEAIAKVSNNGSVSGRTPGTCIITCMADDGTGMVDSCTVTVVQQANGIRAVYADGSNAAKILMPAGKNRTILLNYIPADASWKETTWTQTDDVAVVDRRQDAQTVAGQPRVTIETVNGVQPRNPVVTVYMESGEEITLHSNRPGKAIINGRAADGGQGKVRIDVLVEPAVSVFGTYDADSGTQNGIPWIQPFVENTSTYRTVDSLTLELRARDRRDNDMEYIYEKEVEVYIMPGRTKSLPRVVTSEEYKKATAICYRIVGAHYTDGSSEREEGAALHYIELPY